MRQDKFFVILSKLCFGLFLPLFCLSCHKDSTTTAPLPTINFPTINTFDACPNTINSGGTSALVWAISNATQITIDNGVGDVTNLRQIKVSPLKTTQYTITATNSTGTRTAQTLLNVSSPPISQLLYYGGNQLDDAPTLDGGTYEAAARFTPTKIAHLVGKTITEIHYYLSDKPDSIKVKLYGRSG